MIAGAMPTAGIDRKMFPSLQILINGFRLIFCHSCILFSMQEEGWGGNVLGIMNGGVAKGIGSCAVARPKRLEVLPGEWTVFPWQRIDFLRC